MILDDGAYGMIRWKQASDNFPDYGMTFDNPDFVTYAQAYEATGHRIGRTEDLVPTLEAASVPRASTSSRCRSTTRKTPASWSRSCAAACDVEAHLKPNSNRRMESSDHAASRTGL